MRSAWSRVSLLGKFAVLSFVVLAALGLAFGHLIRQQIEQRALSNARSVGELIAGATVKPRLSAAVLRDGLGAQDRAELNRAISTTEGIERVKVWDRNLRMLFSDDERAIGKRFPRSENLAAALAGQTVVEASELQDADEASQRSSEKLLEVYVPLQLGRGGRPEAISEVYLSYAPIAAAMAADTRQAYLLLAGSLLVLYAGLYRIVARASHSLRRQAADSERVAAEREHEALHDPLTGLANRRLFYQCLEESLTAAREQGLPLAMLLVDLDRFKELNDTLGHDAGDVLLRQIGPRLDEIVRETDTLARLGGDEFALLLPPGTDATAALAVASRLRAALEGSFWFEELELHVEASVGIAVFPEHGEDAETLMQRADVAMYVAKEAGSAQELYTPASDRHSKGRLALLGELRRAIGSGELVLHYQPQCDVRTGRVQSVEALVRWQHPERGLLGPGEFLPMAEKTGLMRPLTREVLDRALAETARWQREGHDIAVSVNLSAANLLDTALPHDVAVLLEKWRMDPRHLILEITENIIMADPVRTTQVIGELAALGVYLSLDDFGTGYSSLAHLKRLRVDELKIDKSFVMHMAADPEDAAIVRSTIALAHSLKLRVVAEGVESGEALGQLADFGCDIAQGFYLSRPVPAAELQARFLERSANGHRPHEPEDLAELV